MPQFNTLRQPPPAQPGRKWIWIISLGGLGLGVLLCSALAVILAAPQLLPSLEPTPVPSPTPSATVTEIVPTPTLAPTLTPTPHPTSTPRPTLTPPLPTSTKAAPPPTAPPATVPPAPPATVAPAPAAPGDSGTIYLESHTTSNATCRISVWGMGTDFLMDAGPGCPASRQVTPGEYGWQAFFGPSGQTRGLSMNVPAGGSCTIICYDTYVEHRCTP